MKKLTSIFILIFSFSLRGQWVQLQKPTHLDLNSVFFLNAKTGWISCDSGVVLKTSDGGLSWNQYYTIDSVDLLSIQFHDSLRGITVGTRSSIFITNDGGLTWILKNINPDIKYNAVKYIDSNKTIIVGDEGKVLLSTNWGSTWETINLTPWTNPPLYNVSFCNSQIGWIGSYYTVLKSEDGGYSWMQSSGKDYTKVAALTDSTVWRIGWNYTIGGEPLQSIQISIDGGINWESRYLRIGYEYLLSIYIYNRNIGFVLAVDRIIYTTDGGTHWEDQYSFPSDGAVNDFCFVDSSKGWIVGNSGRIFKTMNGGGIFTGIEKQDQLIQNFFLFQNYPNPFNLQTKIKFTVPKSDFITLTVYDLLGNCIATLVNEEKQTGTYEVGFDGKLLSSGIYFYRIQAGNFSDTKKFLLLK